MRTKKRKPGPKPGRIKSRSLCVRIPLILLDQMENQAAKEGVSIGSIVRSAINHYLVQ